MATLAIQGHATRGKEVIGLLELLGGQNRKGLKGTQESWYYGIEEDCEMFGDYSIRDSVVFTLEEFLEKYPYKVGDKVNVCGENAASVIGMRWESDYVVYRVRLEKNGYETSKMVDELQPYTEQEEESMEEKIESFEVLESHCGNEVKIEFDPSKFEIIQRENSWYVVKKQPQYPKTYEECCKVLMLKPERATFSVSGLEYKRFFVVNLQRLLICRDAYWKIAGDWKPDWEDGSSVKYIVTCVRNEIKCQKSNECQRILAFPTAEMRDAFYENFKELINETKELL